ncbi:unnamed protein product [Moneuplotes crassus]|uniref:Uncharacterized protein n=1 Tax=Euplotes crassus TaxID=5936 RepID=A0AAD2D7N5_EUPCR|nr:unnamed protein product [Moneuplotes crassus]|mmetsp:Transcript_6983/g.6516  ORF Transcript_6983/g.6516 Transcript_6983/m.6516 type:complete len:84 (-) Transcript_6983:15-266(-)
MVAGIVMFALLILLQYTGNKFLVKPGEEKNVSGQINALLYAMLINVVCLVLCCGTIKLTKDNEEVQEKYRKVKDLEESKQKED